MKTKRIMAFVLVFLFVISGNKLLTKNTYAASNVSKAVLLTNIVTTGKSALGTPYKYGGTNLKSGVDCSGFVYSVYKANGILLNRSSKDMVKNGTEVNKDSLSMGDLVFFDTTGANDGKISHVGIYLGANKFIHASSGKARSVTISSLGDAYYKKTYVKSVRVAQA